MAPSKPAKRKRPEWDDLVVAFGPEDMLFIEYGDMRKMSDNVPDSLKRLYDSKNLAEKIVKTLCLAFTEHKGWLVTYKNGKGKVKFAFESIPQKLQDFLHHTTTKATYTFKISTLRFSIAQGDRFFASVQTTGGNMHYRWDNLTPQAEEWAQTLCARTQRGYGKKCSKYIMSLGVDDDYIIYQYNIHGGKPGWSYKLGEVDHKNVIARVNKNKGDLRDHYIVLSPYYRWGYIMLNWTRWSYWCVSWTHYSDMGEVVNQVWADRPGMGKFWVWTGIAWLKKKLKARKKAKQAKKPAVVKAKPVEEAAKLEKALNEKVET